MAMSVEEILAWFKERTERAAAEVAATGAGLFPFEGNKRLLGLVFDYWADRDRGSTPASVADWFGKTKTDCKSDDRLARFVGALAGLEELAATHPTTVARYDERFGMRLYLKIPELCDLLAKSEEKSLGGEFLEAARLYVGGASKAVDDDSIALTKGSRKTLLLALHGLCKAVGINPLVPGERGKKDSSPSHRLEDLLGKQGIYISKERINDWFKDIPDALKDHRAKNEKKLSE